MAEVFNVLPSPTSTLYAVWPSNNIDGADCICPFCNDVTTQCFLSSCYCYNTSFAPQLVSDPPRLCWPISFSNHNVTDVYFYTEDRRCSNVTVPNLRGPLLIRTYIYTVRLVKRGEKYMMICIVH